MAETNDINLRVLKRRFPDTDSILSTSPYVQVGLRNEETGSHESHLICGPLFVVKSLGRLGTFYNIVVLSQNNFSDFTVEITRDTVICLSGESYIHFKRKGDNITRYIFTDVPGEAVKLFGDLVEVRSLL